MAAGRATGRLARRLGALLAASLAALALLSHAASPEPAEAKPGPSPEFFGVVSSAALTDTDFAQMSKTGVRTLRVMLSWSAAQPTPATLNWGAFDYFVGEAARHGIRVFPTIYGTPSWAHFVSGTDTCDASCAPSEDASRTAFANFARLAVERYGPGGEFWEPSSQCPLLCPTEPAPCGCTTPLPVRSWQIWNEQNSPKYYRPAPNPANYAHLLFEAAGAIRGADPNAEIVLGGMWGPPGTAAVMPTAKYLKKLYAVSGVENVFDAVAVHPYAASLRGVTDQVRRVRKVAGAAGDGNVGTWITELGWASAGSRSLGLVKTPRGQARLLTKSFGALIAKRRAWRIRGITWYSWRDVAADASDCLWCPYSGLRTKTGSAKPAGRAFKRVARGRS